MVSVFIRWTWMRAVLHNGWWLVTSVYLVVDAGLSPAQLVLIGSVQSAFALVFEIPAGVVADTISRKWSLVISQVLMGTAMLATGLFESFPALLATQVLWGISWTFASGSDVALITDELDGPDRINGVLARAARAQLTGAATGLVVTADIRATTHSFLAQLEYLGEIVCGVTISTLAGLTSVSLALTGCAVLFAATAVLMRFPTREEAVTR
ncbi:hypothetical protein ACWGID_18825 [Kribbella sp. NPDC054772]